MIRFTCMIEEGIVSGSDWQFLRSASEDTLFFRAYLLAFEN